MSNQSADICVILEGSYPYVSGGVSTWTHNLIRGISDKTFHLLILVPNKAERKLKYELPENVVGFSHIYLQDLPKNHQQLSSKEKKSLFEAFERVIMKIQYQPSLKELKRFLEIFEPLRERISGELLLDSKEAWNMLMRVYRSTVREGSFLNFFWSWRSLVSSFSAVMLSEIPKARVYHTFCTGFAGLFLARAHITTKRPCYLTEHGIYTNERRIEILSAVWLNEVESMNLTIQKEAYNLTTKDLWTDSFLGYSKLCYDAAKTIITLFKDNQEYQLADGADPKKMKVIANGIDLNKFGTINRIASERPTVALIGRVVQIKDTKTFIRAISYLRNEIPNIQAYIIGPTEEEEEYYLECLEYVEHSGLSDVITFTGRTQVVEYLEKVDVHVLSSISEAQPLSVLEAGACGIPSVVTNVGACHEIIYGAECEEPNLGQGGIVSSLANPQEMAEAVKELLKNKEFYNQCSQTMVERVKKYYDEKDMLDKYENLYEEALR